MWGAQYFNIGGRLSTNKSNRGFPKPPVTNDDNQRVTSDDIHAILNDCLHKAHRDDPTVLAFISSYVMYRDLTSASKAAGMTKVSARNLRNRKDIDMAIQKITGLAAVKYGLDPDEIVQRVKDVAFVDPGDIVDENGVAYTNLRDIPEETRKAIKKFKVKNLYEFDPNGLKIRVGELVEIEMYDRLKATEMLGREVSLFKETKRVEHDVTGSMKSLLLESKQRAEQKVLESREIRDVKALPEVMDEE